MTIPQYSVHFNQKSLKPKDCVKQAIDQVCNGIKKLFTRNDVNQIAIDTEFTKRASGKVQGYDFLATLLTASAMSHASLEKMSEIHGQITRRSPITAQAIMNRINNKDAISFVKSIFSKLLQDNLSGEINCATVLSSFSQILIEDSTVITLHEKLQREFKGSGGRSSRASLKLDVIYDYKSKKYLDIKVTDQSEADQKLGLRISSLVTENTLVIRDLGYLRVDGLQQIVSKKGFYLSRFKSNTTVFLNKEDDAPIDLANFLEFSSQKPVDMVVYITAQKFPVRLVAYRAPQKVADKRRREGNTTAKKQGRTLQESTLKLMNFTIFITNVPVEIWKLEVISTIYRIRWQIELIFKNWKSRAHIDYLKGINPNRIYCLVYIKLIYILLVNKMYVLAEYIGSQLKSRGSVSHTKIYEWMIGGDRILKLIKGHLNTFEKRLFIKGSSKHMCEQRRSRKSTFRSVSEIGLDGSIIA